MLPASQVDLVDCCDIDICQQYSCHCYCYDNDSGLLNTSPVSGQDVQDSCAFSTEQSEFKIQNHNLMGVGLAHVAVTEHRLWQHILNPTTLGEVRCPHKSSNADQLSFAISSQRLHLLVMVLDFDF